MPASWPATTTPTEDQLRRLADHARAVATPTRLALLLALAARSRPLGEVAAELGMTPGAAVQHSIRIRAAGLTELERHGVPRRTILTDEGRRFVEVVARLMAWPT